MELEDMVHMAMKVERQLKRKGTSKFNNNSISFSWKENWGNKEEKMPFKPINEISKNKTSGNNIEREKLKINLKVPKGEIEILSVLSVYKEDI